MRISDWSSDVCSSDLVWADTAYRSRTNETWLADRMLTSRIHRRKAKGKSMPKATARANAAKSAIRARIEHVPAHQKNRFGLFIRPVGSTEKRRVGKECVSTCRSRWWPND